MDLSLNAIEEFKQLYLKQFGIQITNNQAIEYGTNLVDLIRVVYGNSIPKSLDEKKKREYDRYGHS